MTLGTGRRRAAFLIVLAGLGPAGAAPAADVRMSVALDPTVLPGACPMPVSGGLGTCAFAGAAGSSIAVTFALDAPATLHGYDFQVSWDPTELTLVSTDQLFPDADAPNALPFLVAPAAAAPAAREAVTLSLVGHTTTALMRMNFVAAQPGALLSADCLPDVAWAPNGNGLAPSDVVLGNPTGAGIDFGTRTACADGLDNDGDGAIDFDGGLCAGLAAAVSPDTVCGSWFGGAEAASCGVGFELAVLLPVLRVLGRRRRRA